MNRSLAPILCLFLSFGILGKAWASDTIRCDFISPVDALKRSTITKAVTLHNSSEIFREIAALFDGSPPSIQKIYPNAHLTLAWLADPEADKLKFEESFVEGDSIHHIISTFAHRRAERLTDCGNYLIIYPVAKSSKHEIYLYEGGPDPAQATTPPLRTVAQLYSNISLINPDGDSMESFINIKLGQSASQANDQKITFRMDAQAKQAVETVSLIGDWTYAEMLNAICSLTGLAWELTGQEILLKQSQP